MILQQQLEQASQGLMMMSESDYPFDYVLTAASAVSDELLLQLSGKPAGSVIGKKTVEYLFRNMANAASGSVSEATAARFQQLMAVLKSELSDVTVYRVGEVQVEVYILGIAKDGKVAGLHTRLIET